MTKTSPSLLIITGTVGVGKSSVADEVYEALKAQHEPVALVNIDELSYAAPRPVDDPYNMDLRTKNLTSIWPNYTQAGVKSMIIPCVVENTRDVEQLQATMPGASVFVVRLDALLSTIEARIKARPMGGSLEWHLKRANELKEVFSHNDIADTIISTDYKTIAQVASEVIAAWPR